MPIFLIVPVIPVLLGAISVTTSYADTGNTIPSTEQILYDANHPWSPLSGSNATVQSNYCSTDTTLVTTINTCVPNTPPGQDFGNFGISTKHTGFMMACMYRLHNGNGVFIPWTKICERGSQFLLQPCSTLLNPDGSLTAEGDKAVGYIAKTINLPFDTLKNLLQTLSGPTGCGGIVDMNQIQNSDMFQLLLQNIG